MQRVTITLEDELVEAIDRVIATRGYQNRSEAIRDLARAGMAATSNAAPSEKDGVAALVYVYDYESRELAKRLTRSFHDHHDLSLATMHVHLDHESCMEIAVLRGTMADIHRFAEHVIAERGVRHGRLVAVPVEVSVESHSHGGERGRRHLHTHVKEAR
jgi:CopG family transcriptional regulator, nickel-responsive regulator